MFAFLIQNLATIIVGLILAGAVVLIAVKLIRDKKKGKTACGCSCEECGMQSRCNPSGR